MTRKIFYSLPLLVFILIATLSAMALDTKKPDNLPSIQTIPAFSIEGLNAEDLKSEPYALVNFFASWCGPCEIEHPELIALQKNFPVYGAAFMDEHHKLDDYFKKNGNPYKKLGYDDQGVAAVAWGVEGVPTSFLVSRGVILERFDGPLRPQDRQSLVRKYEQNK